MRYEKGRKESTSQRIVDVASQRFRKDGVAAAGLAGIMAEAGLTNGAFYKHFESKESLVREAIVAALNGQHAKVKETLRAGGIEAVIRSYLNMRHLPSFGTGCPSAALLPEIARESEQTRTTYINGLQEYVATLAENLPGSDAKAAHQTAMVLFSLMVGTLQIARSVPEASLAKDILEGGIRAALRLIEEASQSGGN
jgi:TetR/AcrR family transcriptional repressor of nem operon